MNKKGQGSFGIFQFMIVAFLAVILLASLVWTMGIINDVMTDVGIQNDQNQGTELYVNMTLASEQTFGQLNQSIQALRMVAIAYILAYACIVIFINALRPKNPIWFFAYLLILLLAVLFAPTISNAYESLLNEGIMDGTLSTFTASNWVILNLPTIVLVVGIFGGLFLLANIIRGVEDVSTL